MGTRAFIRKGARVLLRRIQSCPLHPFDTDQETFESRIGQAYVANGQTSGRGESKVLNSESNGRYGDFSHCNVRNYERFRFTGEPEDDSKGLS